MLGGKMCEEGEGERERSEHILMNVPPVPDVMKV